MIDTNNASLLVYASLLVTVLAHAGWVLSQNDAVAIVAGIFAFIGAVWQHVTIKKVAGIAKAAGAVGIK